MSQITRCPSCGTKFKVVADQLRISDGWVRCGQCQGVFDAAAALLPAESEPAPVAQPPAAPSGQEAVPAGYELPAAAADEAQLPLGQPPALSDDAQAPAPERDHIPGDMREGPLGAAAEVLAKAELPESKEPSTEEPEAELPEVPAAALPAAEPGFVRAARRKAFWQRAGVRAALGFGCAVLALGLAAQVALQQRNELAAWQPSLRPALQSLSDLTGCSLAARQDIAQLVIASSGFTRTADADRYLLSLTIENQASTELAMPAVELTLTDVQDRPVLRRVLLPAEMQAPATLAAQAEWSTGIALAVSATDTRIAGYRALVFYP